MRIISSQVSFRKWKVLLVLVLLFPSVLPAQSKGRQLINEMVRGMSRVQTMSGTMRRLERIDGEMVPGKMRFKFMMDPRKAYLYTIEPDEGSEVLYVEGWNGNKAYVRPNKFPWVNLSFSITSSVLLKGQHPMSDMGFEYTLRVIKHLLKTRGDVFDDFVQYKGQKKWYGQTVDILEINYGDNYGVEDYVIQGDEDLFDVDRKLCVPAYRIVELNDDVDDFFDVSPGQKIKVPNVYAMRVIFMVDQVHKLPIVQIIYDDVGMFSKYEYLEYKINPIFQAGEFMTDYPEYGF